MLSGSRGSVLNGGRRRGEDRHVFVREPLHFGGGDQLARERLVFDDQKPRDMAVEVPERIEKGTRMLPVKASATPIAAVVDHAAPAVPQHVAKHPSAPHEGENGATKPEQQQERGRGVQQPAQESQHSGGKGRGNANAVGHAKEKQQGNSGSGAGGRSHRQASAEPAGSVTAAQPEGRQAKGRGNAARSSGDQGKSGGQSHGSGGGHNAAQSGLELPQAGAPDLSGDLPKARGN